MTFKNDHLSYSRITRFEQCPKSFELHYIDGVPETAAPEQRLGAIVRQALQQLLREHVAAGHEGTLSPERALAVYQDIWTGTAGVADVALFNEGAVMLRDAVEREGRLDPSTVLAIEQPFELQAGESRIVGSINRVDRLEGSAVRVRVYKTGHLIPTREEVAVHLQFSLYHAAAAHLWPWAERIELQFDMLRHGLALKTSRTPEQIASALAYVQAMGEASEGASSYPARLSPGCVRCSYRGQCEAYADALQGKPEPAHADPNDLVAVAREREQVTALAAILQGRKKELDGELKAHVAQEGPLDVGGIRYQIQNAASVEYPLEPTLAALAEATGASREELRAKLAVVDNAALESLLKQLGRLLPRPRIKLLQAELDSRASKSFTRRLWARPIPA